MTTSTPDDPYTDDEMLSPPRDEEDSEGAALLSWMEMTDARLDGIEGDLADLLAGPEEPTTPALWRTLDRVQAEELWEQLSRWVAWLDARYVRHLAVEALRIPPCWWRHPVAVEELTALMLAHTFSYRKVTPRAGSINPADWHQRSLWPTLRRMSEELKLWKDCSAGHPEPKRVAWEPDAEFLAAVQDDLTRYPEPPTKGA